MQNKSVVQKAEEKNDVDKKVFLFSKVLILLGYLMSF